MAALLGGIGLTALSACVGGESGGEGEPLGSAAEALAFGADIRWVDTVLGPGFPTSRNLGELAILTSAQLGATVVIAEGCVAPGDGGGGIFYWSSTPGVDDGGTFIVPAAGGGQVGATGPGWKRIHDGTLNVRWFGAWGDNNPNHTDTAAILNAIAAAKATTKVVFLPQGTYRVHQPLPLDSTGLRIFGSSTNWASIYVAIDDPTLAVFPISANDVTVQRISLYPASADLAHRWCGFSFTSADTCVVECRINQPHKGMFLASGESNFLDVRVSVTDFMHSGIDFSGSGAPAGTTVGACRIRIDGFIAGAGAGQAADSYGIWISGTQCVVEGGEITACKWPLRLDGGAGPGGHVIKDVYVELVDNGVWASGGKHWIMNGTLAQLAPRIDPGASLAYLGLDATGTIAADITIPAAVVATPTNKLSGLRPIMAGCTMTSQQTVAAGATSVIDFAGVAWDSDHAVTTGPGWKFTCPSAGVYRITATINPHWGNDAGNVFIQAGKNGVAQGSVAVYGVGGKTNGGTLGIQVYCAKNDVLDVRVFNNTARAVLIDGVGLNQFAYIERIPGS